MLDLIGLGALGYGGAKLVKRVLGNRAKPIDVDSFGEVLRVVYQGDFPEELVPKHHVGIVLSMFMQHRQAIAAKQAGALDLEKLEEHEVTAMLTLAHYFDAATRSADRLKYLYFLTDEEAAMILEAGRVWAQVIVDSIDD